MRPVRKKIRQHFGFSAKHVMVRSARPEYFYVALIIIFFIMGYGCCYWLLGYDKDDIRGRLQETILENKWLQVKLVQADRTLKIEKTTQSLLEKQLMMAQQDILKLKEDLLFYKNITSSRKK